MIDDAARRNEFGAGLRLRIERGPGLAAARPCRPSRDLLLLFAEAHEQRRPLLAPLGSRDRAVRGRWGAFAVPAR